jgi:UDP-N-acetyl-2-amino-2-deoxyglucuronate dehydrogenase
MALNFAIIGVAGYIAPRHLRAIKDTGNRVVAATDPHDSVGILDSYSQDVRYFPEIERFDRHLEKLRRGPAERCVHWVSVCSPNYLHDAHCRLALRVGADVICEKPLVINPWNLDALQEMEVETGHRINTVLQLRCHPDLIALREVLLRRRGGRQHDVTLTYITSRGSWYDNSWKGAADKSGGVATNIGIHFFDLLLWLFGAAGDIRVYHSDIHRMAGFVELEFARVRWFLSVDRNDLPAQVAAAGKSTYRSITVDGQEVEFSEGFTDLHTRVYERAIAGQGFSIADARPSIELTYRIRTEPLSADDGMAHPLLVRNREAMPA